MDPKLFVGFNRQTVTPDESIPLTGFSNEAQRFHTSIAQEICATCIAITDSDDTTVLMVGMDICTVPPYFHEVGRQMVADAVGVPQEHIYWPPPIPMPPPASARLTSSPKPSGSGTNSWMPSLQHAGRRWLTARALPCAAVLLKPTV